SDVCSSDLNHALDQRLLDVWRVINLEGLLALLVLQKNRRRAERGEADRAFGSVNLGAVDTLRAAEPPQAGCVGAAGKREAGAHNRSEEHTSELQSRENLVCR